MIEKLAALSKRQLFWLLVIASFLFLDAVSIWITSLAPGPCIPSAIPDGAYDAQNHQCASFHVFLYENAAIYLERIGRLDSNIIFFVVFASLAILQFVTYISEEWTPLGWFYKLQPIDKFTFALVVLAAVTALIFQGQLSAMQGQLTEMQAEQRPWVYSETPIFLKPITLNVSGVWEMQIEFRLQNTGHLPALNVTPIVQSPVPTNNTGDIIAEYQHKGCVDQNKNVLATITGDTVFPGQIVKRPIIVGIWPKDRAAAYAAINHYDPWIIGCFAYITSTSTLRHFTRFAYIVSQEAKDGGPSSWLPYDPSNIQPDKIHVEPFLFKDSFAAD